MDPAPTAPSGSGLARSQSLSIDTALANELFDHFCGGASTLKSILRSYRYLCEVLRVKPGQLPHFYPRIKAKLRSWRALAIWAKFDKRISHHKVYKGGKACSGQRVLVIGAGPCGLRTAIEAQLLGAKVVVLEKRDRFSRNNVLHLWPYNITDLRGLGAKKFYGKFCAGAIDHISIRQLQCILLKVALLLGVEVFENVGFEDLVEPPAQDQEIGWRARVFPADHPVSQYEFDVLIGADGKRNTLHGFKRKEFRGKLAIAITANFINRHTEAESQVEEISGVAFIFNQKFFNDLNEAKGISLENIVYYKDETHYFVMTAKKQSLLNKGVITQNDSDTAKLLAPDNINQEALFEYAREAADFATKYSLPHIEFAVNHYGKPDVAMFDFTSMFQAENSCRIIERHGHRLLTGLVGDSLLEPFWPTGTGCARGFFGGLDTCWLMRSLAIGKQTLLEALAERESIYRILNQTTPENTCKDYASYTADPQTRYPTLNKKLVLPFQVTHLVDTDNATLMEEELQQSSCSTAAKQLQDSAKKKRRRESHVSADTLLCWFQKQLESCDCVAVTDLTYSFQNGLALCAVIHRYRPELVEFDALDPSAWAENNQIAFDVLEQDLGVSPALTGAELAASKNPDKLTMISYLTQVYELFRKDIPVVKQQAKLEASDDDLLDSQYRHNHPKKSGSGGMRRRQHGEVSIGQLLANDGGHGSKKKKRRSKENDEPNVNKENIEETLRLNRSAHRKRLQKLMEMESSAATGGDTKKEKERSSIKKEERYRIIEEQFAGGQRRRPHNNDSISKYRENKKPKDLKRAIGKLDKDDWNVKNIEDKMISKPKVDGVHKDKVPKWSKAAFQDKFNIMKGKLESSEEQQQQQQSLESGGGKYADIDSSLARLQKKLREGTALETGERGANRVAALVGDLVKDDETPAVVTAVEKKEFTMPIKGSESCQFCEKRVYVVERMSAEGKFFHRSCFRCDYCKILLRLGSYVYLREGPFKGKFFCIPHSTSVALEKYRYRCKADELRDAEKRQKELHTLPATEWDRNNEEENGRRNPLEYLESLPARHKERLLRHDQRDTTPERVEFEATTTVESEAEVPSIMDEDEWTDRNFGNKEEGDNKEKEKRRRLRKKEGNGIVVSKEEEVEEDTSEDSVSDLETDTDDDDEEEEEGPESRPLTADETRKLQKEWIKKYDPGCDSEEEAAGPPDESRHSSSSDSSDSEDDECDYDGEYESSSTSSGEDGCSSGSDGEDDEPERRPPRPPLPAAAPALQRRPKKSHGSRGQQEEKRQQAKTAESDTSTEVGSDDLSSDEDSEFSSGSATECEFTDSEGRPNPFHKEIEEGRVIGPESPDASLRIVQQHRMKTAPADKDKDKEETNRALDPMTFAAKYQYKTPNLSDRLRVEEQKSSSTIQDFSTRRALNLKKNWVSDSATNVAAKQKTSSVDVDNKLKSLMDRLSSQQKLLKPADKPSTQMQHFLSSQQLILPPKMSVVNNHVKSPPLVTSPLQQQQPQQQLRLYPTPPIYRSTSSEISLINSQVPAAAAAMTKSSPEEASEAKPNNSACNAAAVNAAVDQVVQKMEVILDPPPLRPVGAEEDVVPRLAVPEVSLNESGGSKEDDFQSCDENEKDVNEAVNSSFVQALATPAKITNGDSSNDFNTPLSISDLNSVEEIDEPPPLPETECPLATSSPVDYNDFELIDESIAEDSKEVFIKAEVKVEEIRPVVLLLTDNDNTNIYNERNPQERMARMKSCKDREKSVIHDLIMSSRAANNHQRSSSAARRSARVFPTTIAPLPPPPPPSTTTAEAAKKCDVSLKRDRTLSASTSDSISRPVQQQSFQDAQSITPTRPSSSSTVCLPATPLTNPEKFGIPAPPDTLRLSRPVARYDSAPFVSSLSCSPPLGKDKEDPTSPTESTTSNDLEYLDGIVSTDESAASKSTGGGESGKYKKDKDKNRFMKTISGIFSRSASLSAVNRQPRSPPPQQQQPSDSSLPKQQQQYNSHQSINNKNNFRFPRLNFARSSSVTRGGGGEHSKHVSGEAPKADISEFGSGSLAASLSERKSMFPMRASHPSTPPVPLTRKIQIHAATTETADSLSENEENESPDSSISNNGSCEQGHEILEKIMKRGGKTARRAARVAQVKRVRKAQEIQRQLEELDVQHKDCEDRGIRAEQRLRNLEEEEEEGSGGELMHTWFQLLSEKNRLVRREQELLVQAKQLEQEDRSARLEVELREHLMLDCRSQESVVREGEILQELLDISEQREKLQEMLDRDRERYRKEDKDIEAQMAAKGMITND